MTKKSTRLKKLFKWLCIFTLFTAIGSGFLGYFLYQKFAPELPNTDHLKNVKYQTPLNVYSREGLLIAQFGEKKRTPITIDQAPQQLINAFLAAEDDRFFEHPGIDYQGLMRAALQLLLTGKKKQGGSTITMQVTRNFLLSNEKTFTRKIKEIFLALKIEQELSKNEILALYLNKIFLGHQAYGVAAAAQVYYGKPLLELNLAQLAMIAGLPKAPSKFNPITDPERALRRRNYVLGRMLELDYINQDEFNRNSTAPVSAQKQVQQFAVSAPYLAEMVRISIVGQFGKDAYSSGLKVYTTLDRRLQTSANRAVRTALHEYDERHGYRNQVLNPKQAERPIGDTLPATVKDLADNVITAQLPDQTAIQITWENIKWAGKYRHRNHIGPSPKSVTAFIKVNDIIRVRKQKDDSWRLAQIPEVEGALVALNPSNGAILALAGGYDFKQSKFNRVTQSKRQPGSGFKPILYTTALEQGFTAASILNDAPVVHSGDNRENEWRPENYSGKFYGPTRLRTALRKSRNLISIRLLRKTGIANVIASAQRFGLPEQQLPKSLSLALGSGQATPLQMTRVFAVFANGGFLINPYFIDRIETSEDEIIFKAQPKIACSSCELDGSGKNGYAPRIVSPRINFLMNTLLRDVVRRGTATRAMQLGRNDLAGKTGTTNEQRDAWFNGFTPNLVATTWVGFDDSIPLGNKETGGRAALPMWMHFMEDALKDTPEFILTAPEGIVRAYISPETGLLAPPDSASGEWEFFRKEYAPREMAPTGVESTDYSEQQPVESLF